LAAENVLILWLKMTTMTMLVTMESNFVMHRVRVYNSSAENPSATSWYRADARSFAGAVVPALPAVWLATAQHGLWLTMTTMTMLVTMESNFVMHRVRVNNSSAENPSATNW
jgi:hypothetical protein